VCVYESVVQRWKVGEAIPSKLLLELAEAAVSRVGPTTFELHLAEEVCLFVCLFF
jgi:hypothetical protein